MKSRDELLKEKKETIERALLDAVIIARRLKRVAKFNASNEKASQRLRLVIVLAAKLKQIELFVYRVQAQPVPPNFHTGEEAIIKRGNYDNQI